MKIENMLLLAGLFLWLRHKKQQENKVEISNQQGDNTGVVLDDSKVKTPLDTNNGVTGFRLGGF